jgi:hypothetical protein
MKLILTLVLLPSLATQPARAQSAPASPAIYRLQAPAFGGTTMGALTTWRRVAAEARRDTLTLQQVDAFQQILARAASGKHVQQKLGGRYFPLGMQLGQQRVPVLVEEQAARYVVVYDQPGKTMTPGHYYLIQSAQDQQLLLQLSRSR